MKYLDRVVGMGAASSCGSDDPKGASCGSKDPASSCGSKDPATGCGSSDPK